MGFCRRCGDIINKEKCDKCGGAAVSGVVRMNGVPGTPPRGDKWEKKYTERTPTSPSPSALKPLDANSNIALRSHSNPSPSPTRRFPRPISTSEPPSSFKAITPPSPCISAFEPIKAFSTKYDADAEGPVIPLDDGLTLAKVHGTVLSPPPPLHCVHCATVFPVNAVLYPTTSSSTKGNSDEPNTSSFACRTCFVRTSGSLGPCGRCGSAVLKLRSEGKWVEVRDRVWHAKCFSCRGCGKDLVARPMVGIDGEPECEACFGKVMRKTGSPARREEMVKERERRGSKKAVDELASRFGSASPSRTSPSRVSPSRIPAKTESEQLVIPSTISATDSCAGCALPLIPPPGQTAAFISAVGKQYHASCFRCSVCHGPFMEKEGTAVFVLIQSGAAHPHCAPITPSHTMSPMRPSAASSPRFPRPLSSYTPSHSPAAVARPPSPLKSPTFGSAAQTCPSCLRAVSPLERGTVPGPGGGRWHAGCLVCGASRDPDAMEDVGMSGCKKKLDSGAKEGAGRVWCRDCWDNLPSSVRPASPLRSPLLPMHTGLRSPTKSNPVSNHGIFPRSHARVESLVPQMTGSGLPITRQLTGAGVVGGAIARQMTGNGNPGSGGHVAALVRQMTGNGPQARRPRSAYGGSLLNRLENVVED